MMTHAKHRAILFVLALLLTLGMTASTVFADEETTHYQVVINDEADLLTDSEEAQLEREMSKLTEYGNMMFTTVYLDDGDYERYAEATYYDTFDHEPGVNFQIDMSNRKLTLSASTGMEKMIGRERSSIVDNIYKKATNGDYYGCASDCFAQIDRVIKGEKIAHQMKYIDNAIFALILALIINFIVVFSFTRNRLKKRKLMSEIVATAVVAYEGLEHTKTTKKYSPRSSDSGGSGGGSFGGGGFGGGGFSGGSSSHGF